MAGNTTESAMSMMNHALWYVRRDGHVIGPFAEALVCRYIVLGRISLHDELSQDGHFWRKLNEIPDLEKEVGLLLDLDRDALLDIKWREERIKASLRWLDERVSLDRRSQEGPEVAAAWASRRQAGDRRVQPETAEQHHYRQSHMAFEGWLHEQQQRYGKELMLLAILLLLVIVVALNYRPVNPVKVAFFVPSADCNLPAAPKINWSGCEKPGVLLVGSDLSGAVLMRANFSNANLAYSNFYGASLEGADLKNAELQHANLQGANLRGVDLLGAKLEGANMTETELGGAIWVNGRSCKPGSRGQCIQ